MLTRVVTRSSYGNALHYGLPMFVELDIVVRCSKITGMAFDREKSVLMTYSVSICIFQYYHYLCCWCLITYDNRTYFEHVCFYA